MSSVVFALSDNTAAPTWLPILFLAIPVIIMTVLLVPALRGRVRYRAGRRTMSQARKTDQTALASAASIADGTDYDSEALLKALAIAPEDLGPEDGPYDEGYAGPMLGLKAKISTSTDLLEPHLYWGRRDLGQVFIRIGPDEKIEGGTMLGTNRHIRNITVLRVDAPRFTLEERNGKPAAIEGSTPELEGILAMLKSNAPAWAGLYVYAGDEGIVVTRSAVNSLYGWVYDLWLAERIARVLQMPALPDARIGPAWKVPYELGRRLRVKD